MATSSSTPAPPQDPDQNLDPSSLTPIRSNPNSPIPLQSISPEKKTQPLPWSHQETVTLIEAYQEKWYSHRRGPLKANQWEEVAITVAARCGYDEPSKTAIQCRHKMEKLRKRYRAEKQKRNPHNWEYFDRMERGPLPISARPMALIHYHNSNSRDGGHEDDEIDNHDEEEEEQQLNEAKCVGTSNRSKPKSTELSGGSVRDCHFLQKPVLRKRTGRFKRYESDGEEDGEKEEGLVVGGGREVVLELAVEIKAFAEKFVRMENEKMEMMRETESVRMEMEDKRMEMILESRREIVDTIHRAIGSGSHKKLKIAQDI